MGLGFEIRSALLAVRLLSRRLGAATTGRLIWRLKRRTGRGEPWRALGPASSPQEAECRRQAGDVVVLYELATEVIGRDDALALVGEIVRESALIQLAGAVGKIERSYFETLDEPERRRFLEQIVERFPNATVTNLEVSEERFSYDITRCWFVDLTRAAGHPELGPLFCAGDGLYFERHLPEIDFQRPETLSEGAPRCAFRFQWRRAGTVIPFERERRDREG